MALQLPVPGVPWRGVVTVLAFAIAAVGAVAATHLATRTRFFERRERPRTWHGRPRRRSDHETADGLNPFVVFLVTYLVLLGVSVVALDALLVG